MQYQLKRAAKRLFRFALAVARPVYRLLKPIVKVTPGLNRVGRKAVHGYRLARQHRELLKMLLRIRMRTPSTVYWDCRFLATAWWTGGWKSVKAELPLYFPFLAPPQIEMRKWLEAWRPNEALLARFRARRWPANAPRFSILMSVYNVREAWLREAIESVLAQAYPHWELICVNDASPAAHIKPVLDEYAARDPRVKVVHSPKNRGVSVSTNLAIRQASGDYLCFMDHDDVLEPQALHRFAEAVLSESPDLLYSDEAITTQDLHEILAIRARPQFSYDYYISHPYFVHLVGVKAELARQIGGLDESLTVSQDVDFVLRVLEVSSRVTHVPDILYRWRTHPESLGHSSKDRVQEVTRKVLERHFARIGAEVAIEDSTHFNFRDVQFRSSARARVAILIPTKNQVGLLRQCVESLEKTVSPGTADIVVIDHQSDDPETQKYLKSIQSRHRVVPYQGKFNFSAIMNHGVKAVAGPYTHYLFLNNDTAAPEVGWLDHMLGFAQRAEVGIVGAVLLYPDDRVQHAGVIVGLRGAAEHAQKFGTFNRSMKQPELGYNGTLLASRDYSAVTAACMLMRADAYEQVGGFDERLAVGFNDTDICLRTRQLGYKVIQDARAILYHFESQTRGVGVGDPHPEDSALFISRHRDMVFHGDPYYSPLLSSTSTLCDLNWEARCPETLSVRTEPVILPKLPVAATSQTAVAGNLKPPHFLKTQPSGQQQTS